MIEEINTDADILVLSFDPANPDDPNLINRFHKGMSTLTYGSYVLHPQIEPEINPIEDIIMNEMDTLTITISATDSNGHYLSFSMPSETLPSFISLNDSGDGTGSIQFTPGYLDAGVYGNIEVFVRDSGSPQMSDQTTFNLIVRNVNLPPEAIATSDIQSGNPPLNVEFSGQASTDPDGSIDSYHWSLGDGSTQIGRDITHTYETAGKYQVILTVTDSERATDKDTILIVNNPELSQLFISELSYADDISGEFLEIYNAAPYSVDFREYKLIKLTAQEDVIYVFDFGLEERWPESTTIIPSRQHMIIGIDVQKSLFTDYWNLAPETIIYNSGSPELASGNSGYRWQLRYSDGNRNQNDGTLIEDTGQIVGGFERRSYQSSIGNWTHTSYLLATPGYMDNDASLPVELIVFETTADQKSIILKWKTGSEINNLGFRILRSISKDGHYEEIGSYITNINLSGEGSSPNEKNYHFTDRNVERNISYWYKLVDVDYSGIETTHGPILGMIPFITDNLRKLDAGSVPLQFKLHDNYPNPFNNQTTINIDIPDSELNQEIVSINVYNVLGKNVSELYRGPLSPGKYQLFWDGKNSVGDDLASGLYIISLHSISYVSSKKMILLR
jgi:PKD repeat protein